MQAAKRTSGRDRRLTTAGLIAVSAATLLMMGWAVFPTPAIASTQTTTWNKVNGAGFLPCSGNTQWNLTGFGNDADHVSNVTLTVNGDSGAMTPNGNIFRRLVGPISTTAANTNAVATWTWDDNFGAPPTGIVLTISHCDAETTTTTTTTVPSETTTTTVPSSTTTTTVPSSTTTTTVPSSTTTTTVPSETTTTTVPSETTTTTVPSSTTTTTVPSSTTTTTQSPTVSPTSITSTTTRTTTTTPVVAPTTVRPGGTAFTGVENVVPLGAIALMLMTGGSGLLWAGSRRKRNLDDLDD